jgi:hypothetical protein
MKQLIKPLALAIAVTFAVPLVVDISADAAPRRAAKAKAKRGGGGGGFDGYWSVSLHTSYGNCPAGLRYPVYIRGGYISNGGGMDAQISGRVDGAGRVRASVYAQGQSGYATGRLSRSYGSGGWRSASAGCGGSWSASRGGGGY